jgi:hypothetical protein
MDVFQQCEAVHLRHVDVNDNQIRGMILQIGKGGYAVGYQIDGIKFLQNAFDIT